MLRVTLNKELLKSITERVLYNEPLSRHTTFGLGGDAEAVAAVANKSDLIKLIQYLNDADIPYFVIGRGSNLLVSDDGYLGVVIELTGEFRKVAVEDNIVTAGAAVSLAALIAETAKMGLSGLENLSGIPGSIGGAVRMNASAYETEIGSIIEDITLLKDGKIIEIDGNALEWNYRGLGIPLSDVILSAAFRLKRKRPREIAARVENIIALRRKSQPITEHSAGCIFRNPTGQHAGEIIDRLGLKGISIGKATVSARHANFIIVQENAKANDVWELIKKVKREVKEKSGIELELEVIPKGSFDGTFYR